MTYAYYHTTVDRIIDGDSVVLTIDLGNKTSWSDSFRLMGIDTPERGQPGYVEATERLCALLAPGVSRSVTHKPDKFGRWLVDLYVAAPAGGELHVNQMLVSEGYARSYSGGKKPT